MGKLDDEVEKYVKYCAKQEIKLTKKDRDLLRAVAKGLGPSIYKKDAALVAAGDKKELETIKKNFLIQKLGLKDTPKLDEGMQAAIDKIGRSSRTKYRPVLYLLLVKQFRKSKVYLP